jgi:hypothetical protein
MDPVKSHLFWSRILKVFCVHTKICKKLQNINLHILTDHFSKYISCCIVIVIESTVLNNQQSVCFLIVNTLWDKMLSVFLADLKLLEFCFLGYNAR